MRARFGLSAAVAAQFGPSVLARNDVGEWDTILGRGQKRTSWANAAMKTRRFRSASDSFSEHFEERAGSG